MNEFWTGVTGDKDKAFAQTSSLIPDNTYAVCEIKSAKFVKPESWKEHFEITWRIIEGPFQNRLVWQKLYAFDDNNDKAMRARNMLMLTYNVTKAQLPEAMPTENDLLNLVGKLAKIRIQIWDMNGKQGNWVSEVHDTTFEPRVKSTDRIMGSRVDDFENDLDDAIPF
jgi:hypothetical protein